MADTIKFRRGSNITASTTEKPKYGEPVYDATNGKLFIGTDASENTSVSTLNEGNKFFWRWDKVTVPATKITGTITTGQIGNAQVTSTKIGTSAVKTGNIDDDAVNEDKIADYAVTVGKLNVNGSPSAVRQQDPANRTDVDAYFWELAKYAAGDGVVATSAERLSLGAKVGSDDTPVYFDKTSGSSGGIPVACSKYAGATKITKFNGQNASSTAIANIYAPTSAGTSNNILKSNGSGSAPSWFDATTSSNTIKWYSAKNADSATTATNANKIRINNNGTNAYYTLKFENGVLQFNS